MKKFKRYFAILLSTLILTSVCVGQEISAKDLNELYEMQLDTYKAQITYEVKEEYRSNQMKEVKRENFYLKTGYLLIIIATVI